jgi:hypothetical protein
MDNKLVDPISIKNENVLRINNYYNNNNIAYNYDYDNNNIYYRNTVFDNFRKKANLLIKKNHNTDELSIFKKISNDIVYNEKSHITAVFKDFLIYDDYSEFMKR